MSNPDAVRASSEANPPAPDAAEEPPGFPSRSRPVLAFVDCDIVSGKDELAREQLLDNVRRYRTAGVTPLWVNWLRHRADLRFVSLVRDFAEFNAFILDVVRSVDGVRETSTILSFGGRADLDTLLDLEMEVSNGNRMAVSVMVDVQPGLDRRCFQGLLDLPPHPDVRRVWLLNTYHSDKADLQMLLVGKSLSAVTGYVMSWVRTTPGVLDTEIDTVLEWRWLANPDDIIELCEMFFTSSRR
jgi:hypothetical protein